MVGEMVGSKGSKGAIVYGAYSFFDKISNGIIIFCIMVNTCFFLDLIFLRTLRILKKEM